VYDPYIRTVMLYPANGNPQSIAEPALTTTTNPTPLLLEFDELSENTARFYAKIFHCNANWQPSRFFPNDYLNQFNEFPITDFSISGRTRVPYVHYRFRVPPVKLPGNYVLVVYNEYTRAPVLSARFLVAQPVAAIRAEMRPSAAVAKSRSNQLLQVAVNYQELDVTDPNLQLKVVVRRNQRWDQTTQPLAPTYMNNADQTLLFEPLEGPLDFEGGNEYRFFDLRGLNAEGANVERVETAPNQTSVFLRPDQIRGGKPYVRWQDINGHYFIEAFQGGAAQTDADYVNVQFTLEAPTPFQGDLFITGHLTQFQLTKSCLMQYDAGQKKYIGNLLLKQGRYEYQYWLRSNVAGQSPWAAEGNHLATENQYEVLVYYRALNGRGDLLMGYYDLKVNPFQGR